MPEVDHLPGRVDGPEGLLELAKKFGEVEVYELIMLCRTTGTEERDAGGAALTALGNRLVTKMREKMRAVDPYCTEEQVKRAVAAQLGYMDSGSRSNFYNVLKGGRRHARKRGA
jgi:hypothetical protein